MNAMLDLLRIRGKKAFSTSKLAVLVAGILFAGTFAWFVVPCVITLLASTIPSLWASVRSATAPPYLFIAVNFIILTIWKLSENRALHTDRVPEEENPFNTDVISLRSRDLVSSQNPHLSRKISPEDLSKTHSIPAGNAKLTDFVGEEPSPASASESSCMTTVSAEKSTASSSSNGVLVSKSSLTAIYPEGKEETTVLDKRDETDSLDATWNAITRKSGRWERLQPPPSPQPLTAGKRTAIKDNNALSEGNDDINQRFDDFIKKNYDQIRLRKPG